MNDVKMTLLVLFIVVFTASVLSVPTTSSSNETSLVYGDEAAVKRLNKYLENVKDLKGIPVPEGYEYWKTVVARVTAYDPSRVSCGKYADGKTSLLDNAWKLDGCAVDPSAIPYRTLIHIPGVGFREADDTGSAMKKSWKKSGTYHVDLRMTYPHQARQWGIQWLPIHLFRKKDSQPAAN